MIRRKTNNAKEWIGIKVLLAPPHPYPGKMSFRTDPASAGEVRNLPGFTTNHVAGDFTLYCAVRNLPG